MKLLISLILGTYEQFLAQNGKILIPVYPG